MKKVFRAALAVITALSLVFTLASCAALSKESFLEICETAEAKKAEVKKDSVTVTVSAVFKDGEGKSVKGIMLLATRTTAKTDAAVKLRIDEEQSVLSGGSDFVKASASSAYFDGTDAYTVETVAGSEEKTTRKTQNTTAAEVLAEHPVAARKNNRGSSLEMTDFSKSEYSGETSYIYSCADAALFAALAKEYAAYIFDSTAVTAGEIKDAKGIYTVASDGCVHFDFIKLTGEVTVGGTVYTFEYESAIKTVAEGDSVVVDPLPDMAKLFPTESESGEDGQEHPDPVNEG